MLFVTRRILSAAGLAATLLLSGCGDQTAPAADSGQPPVATIEYNGQAPADSLASVVTRETARGRTPVLYFYADWCGPCRRFRASLTDARVQAALAPATLIKINIDEDAQGLAGRYGIQAVPTFVKVDAQLKPQAIISGDKWTEDVPENIAPVMHQLVATTAYDAPPATP